VVDQLMASNAFMYESAAYAQHGSLPGMVGPAGHSPIGSAGGGQAASRLQRTLYLHHDCWMWQHLQLPVTPLHTLGNGHLRAAGCLGRTQHKLHRPMSTTGIDKKQSTTGATPYTAYLGVSDPAVNTLGVFFMDLFHGCFPGRLQPLTPVAPRGKEVDDHNGVVVDASP